MKDTEKDKNECCVDVWDSGSWHSYKCSKKPKVERDGQKYCTIHDPEYIEKKGRKAKEKYESENCKKCEYHFYDSWYKFCPLCGTKK